MVGRGGAVEFVGGPEPAGAPEVHRLLERAPLRRAEQFLAVEAGALGGVPHGQAVHALQAALGLAVGGGRLFEQVFVEQGGAFQRVAQVRGQFALDPGLDRLRPLALPVVDAVRVGPVAGLAVLPGHRGVVPELVEPGAHERVAAADLVVEEGEGEVPVHRLYPQRELAEGDGERVEVDAEDAALDDVAPQDGAQARLEVGGGGRAGDELVAGVFGGGGGGGRFGLVASRHRVWCRPEGRRTGTRRIGGWGVGQAEQADERAVTLLFDAAVVAHGGVERVGEEAERRQREAAGAAGRVADLEAQDVLGRLGRPAGGRRVGVGFAAFAAGRVVGERAQGALHGGHGETGPGVEAAGTLAGAAPADEVPLAGEDDAADEAGGALAEVFLVGGGEGGLGGGGAGRAGLLDEAGGESGAAGPGFCAGAGGLAGVFGWGGLLRFGLAASRHRAWCRRGRRRTQWRSVGGVFYRGWRGVAAGGCRRGRRRTQWRSRVGGWRLGAAGGLLHRREEATERLVVHGFEALEGQGGLFADGEEDDGVVAGGGQFVVEQALVEDADVLGGEVGEVDRGRDEAAGAALADADLGAGEALQQVVDFGVGEEFVAEAGGLEAGKGAGEAVLAGDAARATGWLAAAGAGRAFGAGRAVFGVGRAGGEQVATVGGDGQGLVVGAPADELEQRQQPGPGAEAAGLRAAGGGAAAERFVQAAQAVALVVHGVVARQQAPGLGEQDDHQAHDDAAGGAVDVGGVDGGAVLLERFAVAADQEFDGLAHPFAQRFGEFGLALAAVADGLEQRRVGAFLGRRPERRLDEGQQRAERRRGRALGEPEVGVPLAPGVEVEAGEEQPPLAAVGEQGEALVAAAQPAEDAACLAPAAADAEPGVGGDEHGQDGAARPEPEVARADALAGDGAAAVLGRDAGAAQPLAGGGGLAWLGRLVPRARAACVACACRAGLAGLTSPIRLAGVLRLACLVGLAWLEAAQALQHEGDEPASLGVGAVGVAEEVGAAPGFALQPWSEVARFGSGGDFGLPLGVEQQAAVGQVAPAGQAGGGVGAHGSRTSMATGKACASPARAWRLGSRRSTMRRRSRSSCSRASS